MRGHVIIDGNNLLHAMHEHAPVPTVGRETMVRALERWAGRHCDDVTLVFDGPAPKGGLRKQLSSRRLSVRFAAPKSADDVIIAIVKRSSHPDTVRVVSSDTAIGYEARKRRCAHTDAVAFTHEVFADPSEAPATPPLDPGREKPESQSPEDVDRWVDIFDDSIDEEPG